MTPPLVEIINDAKAKFLATYGFPAERIHVSHPMEKALVRWAKAVGAWPKDGMQEAEIAGLQILQSTKPSPHVEFSLSAKRNGQLYTSHARLEPHEVDGKVIRHPGETILGEDHA